MTWFDSYMSQNNFFEISKDFTHTENFLANALQKNKKEFGQYVDTHL